MGELFNNMTKTLISNRKWILLPIETKARELMSKILFACVGAERGFGVVIGGKSIIRGKQAVLPRGTFIEKSIGPGSLPLIQKAFDNKNRVSAWCEEGLIYLGKEDYKQRRVDLSSFKAIDYFFVWGKKHFDDMESIVGSRNKLVPTGNPRFDLLRPELRNVFRKNVDKIKKKYGRIILLNTKFATINSNNKELNYLDFLKSLGKIKTKEEEETIKKFMALNEKNFRVFLKLIPMLSRRYKDHTIIIRPHPSEDHIPWIEISKEFNNVKVVFEGNANEWIMAADVMIHNNCTTGIEAFLLEKPVISFRPFKDESVEPPLPDLVSYKAGDEQGLLLIIDRIVNDNDISIVERHEQMKVASEYITNIEGRLACDRILDVLEKLELPKMSAIFPLPVSFKDYLKKIKKLFNLNKQYSYTTQKFPGLKLDEVQNFFENLKLVSRRFNDVKLIQVGEDGFCFYKE